VHESTQTEPYTVITQMPGEVYYIERHVFLECIGAEDAEDFVKCGPVIPDDPELRKKFYAQQTW
jgi:hypothetical protein